MGDHLTAKRFQRSTHGEMDLFSFMESRAVAMRIDPPVAIGLKRPTEQAAAGSGQDNASLNIALSL